MFPLFKNSYHLVGCQYKEENYVTLKVFQVQNKLDFNDKFSKLVYEGFFGIFHMVIHGPFQKK
jgi:hypothetical protein